MDLVPSPPQPSIISREAPRLSRAKHRGRKGAADLYSSIVALAVPLYHASSSPA